MLLIITIKLCISYDFNYVINTVRVEKNFEYHTLFRNEIDFFDMMSIIICRHNNLSKFHMHIYIMFFFFIGMRGMVDFW
jgi:hypothetical protein